MAAVERFSRHYFDRDHAEYLEMIAPAWQVLRAPDAPDVTTEMVARCWNGGFRCMWTAC